MANFGSSVFMIGWEYPPHNSGGLGVACEGLTHALAEEGTHIYFTLPYSLPTTVNHMKVFSCVDPSWLDEAGRSNKPPFLAYSPSNVSSLRDKPVDRHALQVLSESELETKVDQYSESVVNVGTKLKKKFDGIHAHDWMSFPAALKLANKTGKPFIAHVHSTEYDRVPHGRGNPYITHTEYEGLQGADKIIAVSNYTKQLLHKKYAVPEEKISVVHNGLKPLRELAVQNSTTFATNRPVIVFMGRLTMQKGAEYFLQLARSVLQELPESLFIVAGSGDMYHELLFKSAASQLTASVVFSGFVRDAQKAKLLDRADIFVMPSLSEPFGLVALEAAQRRTPVILSQNAGVSEVLPGSIRVDFWDVEKMKAAIVKLLKDKAYAQQVQQAQLRNLQQVTWKKSAHDMRKVYREVFLGSK